MLSSLVYDSATPCPWDSRGENSGVGCHFLLQGIFPTRGLNPGLLRCRQILYRLNHQASPLMQIEVATLFVCRRPGLVFRSWRDPCITWQGGPVTARQLASPQSPGKVLSLQFAEMESSHRADIPFLLSHPVGETQVVAVLTLKGRRSQRGRTH